MIFQWNWNIRILTKKWPLCYFPQIFVRWKFFSPCSERFFVPHSSYFWSHFRIFIFFFFFFFFSELGYCRWDTWYQLWNTYTRRLFHNHLIWPPMFYLSIHFNTDIPQNFHNTIFNGRLNLTFVPPFTYFHSILLV